MIRILVFMADTGECWIVSNEQVRAMKNITGERYEHPKLEFTIRSGE